MEQNASAFQTRFPKKTKLPSLPKKTHVLMQALADNSLTYQALANVIKHYPEISARLIFLANSPWSSPINPISTIEHACSRLGTSIVKSVSIATAVSSSFDTAKCSAFNIQHFWVTSMLVAEGAGLLAARLNNNTELEQIVQTAGVLHNVGLLWLADNFPEETNVALKRLTEEPTLELNEILLEKLGTEYCEVGGWIARQWNMPEVLAVTMNFHPDPSYHDSGWESVLLVGIAAKMVAALHKKTAFTSPENPRLEQLGLSSKKQQDVFIKLAKNHDKTQELAKTLSQ